MKQRIILDEADLLEVIGEHCLDDYQAGGLRIRHYQTEGLGMRGKFKMIDLPDMQIVHSMASLPYQLGLNVMVDQPLLQMHFGLTGYESATLGSNAYVLQIQRNQHNLFYLPTHQKDFLLHERCANYITFEVNFHPTYLSKLLNDEVSLIAEFYRRMEAGNATLLGKESRPITSEMHQIIQAILSCQFPDPLRQLYLETKVQELFLLQVKQFNEEESHSVKLHPDDKQKLYQLNELIQTTGELTYSLPELASEFGLNIDKLKKGYKQLFNQTIFGHVHELRMQKAKELLQRTNQSIGEISLLTGYKNQQHFSKAFKDRFGTLPRDIRREL
ncbi:helix-turn-helix domain-containing protein [Spirosoma sp. HMF4905]|uniref:Helix-turn-helix domain-containing protein n=1 Tax=Spirosoma arboris TaxID=2682092 RepID=A0A7K1SJQ8_9BACT|nr:helix-turn-helix transcriptional regulator [Spirosoma arboris]MVM33968.1 helix-turn-helix domain-containing protein [Spirosoma arboris]